MSTQYEFLMHSILGLAASELIATDPSLAEAAMVHRLKSIQAIKRKLAASDQGITYAEGNALIATCFALTFQSVILEDGSKQLPQDTLHLSLKPRVCFTISAHESTETRPWLVKTLLHFSS